MKYNTKKTFQIYLKASRQRPWSGLLALIFAMAASAVGVIYPIYYKKFFNFLADGSGDKMLLIKSLLFILLILAILKLIEWLFWRICSFATIRFQSQILADLANLCFSYLHKHSYGFFSNSFSGSLVKKAKWFVNSFENIADRFIFDFFPLMLNIIVITVVLYQTNQYLALGIVIWTIVFLIINMIFTNYKMKYDIKRNEAETASTGLLADTITNNATIKFFTGYHREKKRYWEATEKVRKLRLFSWNLGTTFDAILGLLMVALELGMLYLAIRLWSTGSITIGDFVLLQAYLLNIFMRVFDFGRSLRRTYEDLSGAEEMTVILDTPHEIMDVHNVKELKVSAGEVVFDNVDFCYNRTRKVLNKFNLKIDSKERVALIGSSGSGKTTLVKLLLRLYDIESGKILIDNQNIFSISQESLRSNVAIVPQDPILFHRSLRENILYGRPEASEEEMLKASKAAYCHDFISELPEGYDTLVGERGIKLSGGERQRVAIARAILYNAPILVLDEATSSLDSESEIYIQKAIASLMKNKTVLVIAHRLSTIRQMDRIVVLDQGKILEEGSHQELLDEKSSVYKRLWELQAGGFLT
ncbi:MAG: ABC transporter ATP-binding protein [Candidatus Parcubacteria bacterium]|nr:ABC transporter ATP-binding protein [Candidatus Parcubacteria bacterium]